MFGRPRCREWTPLASQQLRLRSLIQIVGYNIRPPESLTTHCSFYLTLHHTTMSAPFYTSEKISSPHPKWKEIDAEITQRISSSNIVVRIWCQASPSPGKDSTQHQASNVIIQTWGVYFSGLRYLGANLARNFTSDCFKTNTLVFQMHGGYFCSYKSLILDVIQPENEIEHSSLSSGSSNKTNTNRLPIESKINCAQKIKECRSVSPSKLKRNDIEYSKSHSPVEKKFKQPFPSMRTSTSLNINKCKGEKLDTNHIFEHSPTNLEFQKSSKVSSSNASQEDISGSRIDLSETAENYDLRSESDWLPKYRYLALNFFKSEIRPSYSVSKLQKLHLLQYSIKKRKEAVTEVKERIYKKCALAEGEIKDQFNVKSKFKSKSEMSLFDVENEECCGEGSHCDSSSKNSRVKEEAVSPRNGPRLTLKLNDLLSLKSKPSPLQRAEHIRLTKQIEILRFKKMLLADERDRKLINIRKFKEAYAKLNEENQDLGSELMENYHNLRRRHTEVYERRCSAGALRALAAGTHARANETRAMLMRQLAELFAIHQKNESTWTICEVPLPISDDAPRLPASASEAVAASYVAQALTLASAILDRPLRYKIVFTPAFPVIVDISPDLPDPNIPLCPRGSDSSLYRYGMFLINKCIVQLLHACSKPVSDLRPTLPNLYTLCHNSYNSDSSLYRYGMFLINKCIVQLLHACSKPVSDLRPTLPNLYTLCHNSYNRSDTPKLFGMYKCVDREGSRTQSLRSLIASDRGKHGRQFNRFKDAVDGQSPQTLMSLMKHRHTKSVGNCNDEDPMEFHEPSATISSDPNIYNPISTIDTDALRSHNSDSELNRIHESETKVVFTLGNECESINVSNEKLVRLSVHSDLDLCQANIDSGFKDICNEIESFCLNTNESESTICECESIGSNKLQRNVDERPIDIVKFIGGSSQGDCTGAGDNKIKIDNEFYISSANEIEDDDTRILSKSTDCLIDSGQSEN